MAEYADPAATRLARALASGQPDAWTADQLVKSAPADRDEGYLAYLERIAVHSGDPHYRQQAEAEIRRVTGTMILPSESAYYGQRENPQLLAKKAKRRKPARPAGGAPAHAQADGVMEQIDEPRPELKGYTTSRLRGIALNVPCSGCRRTAREELHRRGKAVRQPVIVIKGGHVFQEQAARELSAMIAQTGRRPLWQG